MTASENEKDKKKKKKNVPGLDETKSRERVREKAGKGSRGSSTP